VAVDQTNQIIYTFEFKRTLGREHGYVQRCDERAIEQYASLVQIVSQCRANDESASGQFHRWNNFMNKQAWNETMEMVGVCEFLAQVEWNAGEVHKGATG
jgi:hypothetical protein